MTKTTPLPSVVTVNFFVDVRQTVGQTVKHQKKGSIILKCIACMGNWST